MQTVSLCVYCSRPAFRTCTACGMPMCEAHSAPEAPAMCFQCARGHRGRTGAGVPATGIDDRPAVPELAEGEDRTKASETSR